MSTITIEPEIAVERNTIVIAEPLRLMIATDNIKLTNLDKFYAQVAQRLLNWISEDGGYWWLMDTSTEQPNPRSEFPGSLGAA
jgi:hypothetical protein